MKMQSIFDDATCSATANDPSLAILVSKGSNSTTQPRVTLILQNQHATANFYVSNAPSKRATKCIRLAPGGDIVRDLFAPSDDVYVWSDTASAVLSYSENYAGG